MDETIYQESTGNYLYKNHSGICEGCDHLWDEIKDRVAAGDYKAYVEPEPSYANLRRAEYPPIGDQLDAMYKARNGDTAELEALEMQITSIKEKYPKTDQYDYNESTGKYHRSYCQYAGGEAVKSLSELASLNAVACRVCKPPAIESNAE